MLTVTTSLSQAFESQLSLRNIPDQQRRDFHKWLRFYLDFCAKYASDPKLTASFVGFDEKLQSKGQSYAKRMEARRSIAIYYRMIAVSDQRFFYGRYWHTDELHVAKLLVVKRTVVTVSKWP